MAAVAAEVRTLVVTRSEQGALALRGERTGRSRGRADRAAGRHDRRGRPVRRGLPRRPGARAGPRAIAEARGDRRGRSDPALRRAAGSRLEGAGRRPARIRKGEAAGLPFSLALSDRSSDRDRRLESVIPGTRQRRSMRIRPARAPRRWPWPRWLLRAAVAEVDQQARSPLQIGSTSIAVVGRLKNRNTQPTMVSGPMIASAGTRNGALAAGIASGAAASPRSPPSGRRRACRHWRCRPAARPGRRRRRWRR